MAKKKRNDNHNKKEDGGGKEEEESETSLVKDMPLAMAILNNDINTVGAILAKSVPNPDTVVIEDVSISKSLGEAFTGGRSTPVYHVTCSVSRKRRQQSAGVGEKQQQQQECQTQRRQRHFVVKLVLMPQSAAPNQRSSWQKRESYAVERRFYDSIAPRIRQQQLNIPRFLYGDRDGSRPYPAVCFLMNDLRHAGYPNHPEFLHTTEVKRALRWIAKFHAMFWGEQNNTATCRWKRDVWTRGGFWTPKEDSTKMNTNGLAQQWNQSIRWLENKYPSASSSTAIRGLGKRLEAAANPIAEFLTLQSSTSRMGTLIHGDYKAANLFLSDVAAGDEGDYNVDQGGGAKSVAALDFQFTGLGLGAEDVAYLLFPDARGHYFDNEKELLECYHEELISQLILQQKGGPSNLSYENFQSYYELSRIDFLRYLLGKGWVASNEGDVKLMTAVECTISQLDGGQTLCSDKHYVQAISTFVGLQ